MTTHNLPVALSRLPAIAIVTIERHGVAPHRATRRHMLNDARRIETIPLKWLVHDVPILGQSFRFAVNFFANQPPIFRSHFNPSLRQEFQG